MTQLLRQRDLPRSSCTARGTQARISAVSNVAYIVLIRYEKGVAMDSEKRSRVVVGTDYSKASELALERAFELASRDPAVEVHVVSVVQAPLAPYVVLGPFSNSESYATLIQFTEQRLSAFVAQHPNGAPSRQVVCHVRLDRPATEIAQLAADLDADLIVVGTHGRHGVERVLLGSVAELVVRLAPCPVLVVRPKAVPVPTPQIEPPCPRCVDARKSSGGQQYWCDLHLERHGQRHTYHQGDRASLESNFPLVYRP